MFCTQQKWCDLVVRTQDIHIHIEYDDEFWASVMPKLKAFYFTAVLQELSFPLGVTAIREPSDELKKKWQDVLNIYRLMHACLYYIMSQNI